MAPDRTPVLVDPDLPPDDTRIRDALGDAFPAWQGLDAALTDPALGVTLTWRYYRDGGWLCKALRNGRTVAWLAVWDGYATVTCYFAARHREDLGALPIPDDLRARAATAELSGAMLPFLVEVRSPADVAAVVEVVRFKMRTR